MTRKNERRISNILETIGEVFRQLFTVLIVIR